MVEASDLALWERDSARNNYGSDSKSFIAPDFFTICANGGEMTMNSESWHFKIRKLNSEGWHFKIIS